MPIWLFLALSIAAFASSVTLRIADALLPEIAREFATTPGAAATAVITTFTVAYGGIQVAFGPIGDRFGKVHTIAVASLLSVAAQIACALSATLDQISVARVVAGATAGGVIPLCLAWIGDVVSFEDRQKVLARFLLAQIIGLAAGQALGGVIGETFGWRASVLMLAGLYLLGGVAPFLALRATPTPAGSGAVTRGGRVRVAEALSRPRVRLILSTVFLEGAAMYGAFSYVGTDLQHRFGVSVATSGVLLTAFAVGAMGYALFVGRIVAIMTRARIAMSGALILGTGFVVLALIPSLATALVALAATGLGFYMLHNSLQTEATQMVPEARGTALAMFASMLFVGQAVGVAIAGPFFDRVGAPPIYLVAALILPLIAARLAHSLSRAGS
ncbi:MAG: MFS transporter [Rhodospirillaceae bacterium]|nr:MFS transporter [Rhodospirillaceae bacterium]